MYKEIIERKKLPVIICLIFILCIFIYISKYVSSLFIDNDFLCGLFDVFFTIAMIVIIMAEIYKTNIKYKYSIIADQFIIHKLRGDSKIEVENIKFKDIKFIGKKSELKSRYDVISNRRYICSLFNSKKYCCVYFDGSGFRKFYFEPSADLVDKLEFIMNKDKECFDVKYRLSISI
ncbi:hypothetical protein ACFIJ5_17575 [Haloimpatiens sp. FM7330]|uniref:hypothetical protein n=1 Tax=Haloimpatiens sp. FM7330 TaxID=3298610 RepID=UPI0036290113